MIRITDKKRCTGCEACANVCPVQAITMLPDREGFLYPTVDESICVECGLCVKRCPVLVERCVGRPIVAYAVQNKDECVRRESSSGGAFTAIAQEVLRQGGLVFGAAFDPKFEVVHISVSASDELSRFRGSKYVQSRIGTTYAEVKKALLAGMYVCFSGTPCQIEGLMQYLGKPYDNLIAVDVVCHGVPSPKLFRKYLNYQQDKYGPLKGIYFRDKSYGYAGSTMALRFTSGRTISNGRELQFFKDTFFRNLSTRPSCYACPFKTAGRVSDFTLFDCWHIGNWNRKMDDDKGTTFVLIHTSKGRDLFEKLMPELRYCLVDALAAVATDGDMAVASIPSHPARSSFFADMDRLSVPMLMKKYVPSSLFRHVLFLVKPILFHMHLLPILKRLLK